MDDKSQDSSGEAAGWLARLNQRSVSSEELQDFYAWRRDPRNAAAYAEAERLWRNSRALGDDPEIAAAVKEALERPRHAQAGIGSQLLGGRPFVVGAGLLALLLVTFGLHATRPPTFETAIGEQRLVRLEDGSRLRLNTDTEVQVDYSSERREVELARGEAFFEVHPDPERPFVVRSGAISVRAIGTRFDVRLAGPLRVVLVEGSVAVAEGGESREPARLAPGEAFILTADGRGLVQSVDIEQVTSWTSGRMVFRETPLAEAIAEANRYSTRKIALEAGGLASLRVDGTFETGDVEAFVAALTALFPLEAQRDRKGNVTLRPA